MEFEKIKRVRRVTVTLGDESFWMNYVPRRWNKAFVDRHNEMIEEENKDLEIIERGRERFIFTLVAVVDNWDICQDGTAVDVSEEFLRQVDDNWLFLMYWAVRSDIEDEDQAKNS